MNSTIQDLLRHQAWSNAELWRAIEINTAAREDEVIRKRLHHIHLVQRLFIWAVGDRKDEFSFGKPDDFKTFEELRAFARRSHAIIDEFMSGLDDTLLANSVTFSWFKDPPLANPNAETRPDVGLARRGRLGETAIGSTKSAE